MQIVITQLSARREDGGVVADPGGQIAGRFGKLNPYGEERTRVSHGLVAIPSPSRSVESAAL